MADKTPTNGLGAILRDINKVGRRVQGVERPTGSQYFNSIEKINTAQETGEVAQVAADDAQGTANEAGQVAAQAIALTEALGQSAAETALQLQQAKNDLATAQLQLTDAKEQLDEAFGQIDDLGTKVGQAQSAADTASSRADAALIGAGDAKTAAQAASSAATAAGTAAADAKTQAAAAKTASDQATAQALAAAGIAAGKGTLYNQPTAPTFDPNGLWFDSDDGNKAYRGVDYGLGSGPSTNRIANPGFNAGIANWVIPNGTWDSAKQRGSGVATVAIGNGGSLGFAAISSAAPGESRRFGIMFYNTGTVAMLVSAQAQVRSASGVLAYLDGAQQTVQPGASAFLTTATSTGGYPANTTGVQVFLRSGGVPVGAAWQLDSVIDTEFVAGSGPRGELPLTLANYFDGSMLGATWSGAANASTSTFSGPQWVPIQDAGILAAAQAAAGAQSTANTAKSTADTAKATADLAKANAAAAQTTADNASAAASAAQTTANGAKTAADNAKTAADTANAAALSAAGLAADKGKLIVQVSAPTGSNADPENLWFDISGTPPKNQPNRFGPVTIPDPNAVAVILPAASAQTETEVMRVSAVPNAVTPVALTLSISMQLNSYVKYSIARLRDGLTGAILASYIFTDKGDSGSGNAETWTLPANFTATPTSSALVVTIQSNNANSPTIFSLHRTITANNWTPITDQKVVDAATSAASAQSAANTAKTAADAAQATADAAKTAASTAQQTADTAKTNAATAQTAANNAQTSADAANAAAGSAQTKANQASADAAAAAGIAAGKADTLIQSTAPATAMQKATTLWIDTTNNANTPKRWSGSAWVAVTDKAATDAAAAAANAATAAATAKTTADNAATAASTAQSAANAAKAAADAAAATANGRPQLLFGSTAPSGTAPQGTTWFQTDASGNIIGQWQQTAASNTGSTWTARQMTDSVIANLTLGKLQAGTAAIIDAVVQKIAAQTANIQTANIANLFVTSGATMNTATIQALYTQVVKAYKITADMIDVGTLNGVTLVGTTIKSAASGRRVEMIYDRLDFYNSDGKNIGRFGAYGLDGTLQFFSPDTATDPYNPEMFLKLDKDSYDIGNLSLLKNSSQRVTFTLTRQANGKDHAMIQTTTDEGYGICRFGVPDSEAIALGGMWDVKANSIQATILDTSQFTANVGVIDDLTVPSKLTIKSPYSPGPNWTTTINTDYTGVTSPDFRITSTGKSIVPVDTGWRPITINAGFTATDLAYRIIGDVVYYRGTIKRNAGQFPAGYTPVFTITAAAPAVYSRIPIGQFNGYTALLVLSVNGDVSIGANAATSDAAYLNGVSYLRT